MIKTKIEWCDATFNPLTGCLHRCPYCYAEVIAHRFDGKCPAQIDFCGTYHGEPLYHLLTNNLGAYPYGFKPTFHEYRLSQLEQLKKPRTIFVCSMADMFGEWVPDEWIEKIFKACEKSPQHRYLFLTKNPARGLKLSDELQGKFYNKNFWFGATITGKGEHHDIFQGKNTFVSFEPLQELPINYENFIPNVKWIIIGAESGNRKEKVIPKRSWIFELCEVAEENHIPVFMKNSLVPIIGEKNMLRQFPWGEQDGE
jgi:protein gp37